MTTKPPNPLTAAKVRAMLRRAGHKPPWKYREAITRWEPGYKVVEGQGEPKRFVVSYFPHGGITNALDRRHAIACYAIAIRDSGIPCEIVGDQVVVRVEPPKGDS